MARVYAYATIAHDPDEDGRAVYYEPGTDITNVGFNNDQLKHFLEVGSAALYDRTRPPEESLQDRDEELEAAAKRIAELEAQLKAVSGTQSGTTPSQPSS